MKKPETDRAPPVPYVDEDGNRFYNVRQVSQLIAGVSKLTLWHWAKKGVTSFGLELDVTRQPITRHRNPNSKEEPPRKLRESRMLIPEQKVLALKEILQAVGRERPGPFTDCERDALRAATRSRMRRSTLPHG